MGRGVRQRGCAIALPRGCAGGVPLLGTAACPGRPPMWAEGCAGGVCHSPAEGVCQSPAEGAPRIPSTWSSQTRYHHRRSFASCQDCACIGALGIASKRPQLYALLVGSQNVDPENGACAKPEVGLSPLYGPLPSLLFVLVCLGGPDPGTRDPACCRVLVPGNKYRALRLVGQDKTSIEARSQILPLLGGWLDHKQTWQIRGETRAKVSATTFLAVFRREVSPVVGVQIDLDASAAPGLYIGMQKGALQMLVLARRLVARL